MSVKSSISMKELLKASTVANMEKVAPGISISEEGVAVVEKNLFEDFLPEDITIGQATAVQKAIVEFTDATGGAFGEKSIEFFKSNKTINRTTFSAKAGMMTIEGTCDRDKTIRNPTDGSKSTQHGYLQHGASFKNSKKTGQMKLVRNYILAAADEAFA